LRRSGEGEKGRCLPWSKEEEGAYIFWMKQVPVRLVSNYKKQELLIFRAHMGSHPVFRGVRVVHHFSFLCCVFLFYQSSFCVLCSILSVSRYYSFLIACLICFLKRLSRPQMICVVLWVNDFCEQSVSYIMGRTIYFWWNNDDVCFALDPQAEVNYLTH